MWLTGTVFKLVKINKCEVWVYKMIPVSFSNVNLFPRLDWERKAPLVTSVHISLKRISYRYKGNTVFKQCPLWGNLGPGRQTPCACSHSLVDASSVLLGFRAYVEVSVGRGWEVREEPWKPGSKAKVGWGAICNMRAKARMLGYKLWERRASGRVTQN